MAHYTLEIDYTSNENKTAKLKVKNEVNKVILKSDIVIPEIFHQYDSYVMPYKLGLHSFIPKQYSPSNHFADLEKINYFYQLFGNDYIGNKDNIEELQIIKQSAFNSIKNIHGISNTITLLSDDFDTIKNILLEKNSLSLTCNKKWYVFGQKSCVRNSRIELINYFSLGNSIEKAEKLIEQENLEQKNDNIIKKIVKATFALGASFINNKTSQDVHTREHKKNTSSDNKISKKTSTSSSNNCSSSIFANFMQISDIFEDSSPSATSYKSSTDSCNDSSSSSSSDYSSPSYD